MNAPKRQRSTAQIRKETIANAERNPSYRFHDAIVIIGAFTLYTIYLFYGGMTSDDEGES